ncbi:MAG: IS200/IS605 family transposase [Paludibacteraceae bacterium]|nr:IS200/IS605 family transposase [Paludibacteraceae bacterium]
MSYTKILYHIVFRTKSSKPTIPNDKSEILYRYIWGLLNNKKCKLFRINGTPDHIHLLFELHPSLALANLVKEIKTSTHNFLKNSPEFSNFEAWSEGYAALTYSINELETVKSYIANQREHHANISFAEEYRKLLIENGIEINEEYFLKD